MRFAEVFLRLGTSLVAWMMLYAYILWLAAVYVIACGPDGDEMHRLLLGMAPFVCCFALLLNVTHPFEEIQSMLRWLGVPLLLLLPFALRSVWDIFRTVNLNTTAICPDQIAPTWQYLWAPLQMATLLFIIYRVVRVWLSVAQASSK